MLSCCDVNKDHGVTKTVLLEDYYLQFGWMCLYTQPKAFSMLSVWQYCEFFENWARILYLKNEQINKFIYFYVY